MQENNSSKPGMQIFARADAHILNCATRIADLGLEEVAYNFTMTARNISSLLDVKPPRIWLARHPGNSDSDYE